MSSLFEHTEMAEQIAFIGAGNMSTALIRGLIGSGLCVKERVIASDVSQPQLDALTRAQAIKVTTDNAAAVRGADIVVLATKPQVFATLLPELAKLLDSRSLVISIAGGVPIAVIESQLAPRTRVIRAMPNTPALIGLGATAIAAGNHATSADMELAARIFNSVGRCVRVDEHLLDAVTGLSGSGPAYAFVMIEALADAGVNMGLTRADAQLLAAQTLLGAAKLVLESGEHPGQLKDRVTSPGGTTIAGLQALESHGIRSALIDAVEKATLRSKALGQEAARKFAKG
jgi:pyrroline-5-carboxylate reductase